MPAPDPTVDVSLVKDLKPGMRNFSVYVIFLEANPRTITTKEGMEIRVCKVADRTACINLTLINSDAGSHIQPGDICKITRCYVSNYKGAPTLYMSKSGSLLKYSDFTLVFNETLNMSESNPVTNQVAGSSAPVANTAQEVE